ncbi:MAG TPA: Dabb family protein [Bryobacteraceae bacterium]|nr:Dabb family protein [Bryobacteraceae bacterium]
MNRKKSMFAAMTAFLLLTIVNAAAVEMPKTVIHVITIQWKEGATPEQIKKAIGGVETAAKMYPGIKRVWLRSIKAQGEGIKSAVVMEFESEKALKDYVDSPAQKAFYEVYQPVREKSITSDITN